MTEKTQLSQSDAILVTAARKAVSAELRKKRALNNPIAKYDPKDKNVYLVYNNGERVLVGEAMRNGRYSERCK